MSPMTATGFELFLAVAPYSCSDLVRTYADLKTFARTVFTRFGPKTRAMARSGAGFIIGNTTKTNCQPQYKMPRTLWCIPSRIRCKTQTDRARDLRYINFRTYPDCRKS